MSSNLPIHNTSGSIFQLSISIQYVMNIFFVVPIVIKRIQIFQMILSHL